jgi:hypothetical protein
LLNERSLKQVLEHRWPTVDWAVARLTVRLERIAEEKGLVLQSWIEDGLGESTGCFLRLPSGPVIQLIERAHAVKHFGQRGPDLYADAKNVKLAGIERLLSEAIAALGLNLTDVEWRNQAPTAADIAPFESAKRSK